MKHTSHTALAEPRIMRAFTRDPAIIEAAQTLLWISVPLDLGLVFNLVALTRQGLATPCTGNAARAAQAPLMR